MAAQILTWSSLGTCENLPRACSLLHDATHLIHLATSRPLQREDQHILGKISGLASLAAVVSLKAGQSPLEVLRLLELGLRVTNCQLLDYRSEISDLKEQHPMLAKDFDSLRQELDSPFPSTESFSGIPIGKRQQIQQVAI